MATAADVLDQALDTLRGVASVPVPADRMDPGATQDIELRSAFSRLVNEFKRLPTTRIEDEPEDDELSEEDRAQQELVLQLNERVGMLESRRLSRERKPLYDWQMLEEVEAGDVPSSDGTQTVIVSNGGTAGTASTWRTSDVINGLKLVGGKDDGTAKEKGTLEFCSSDGGLQVKLSGSANVYSIDVDTNGLYVVLKANSGLSAEGGGGLLVKCRNLLTTDADGIGLSLSSSKGDIIVFNGTAWAKLGIGSADQVLTVSGGTATWQDAAGGDTYTGGDAIDVTDTVISVDLATDPGLEISSEKLRVKVKANGGVKRDSDGLSVVWV